MGSTLTVDIMTDLFLKLSIYVSDLRLLCRIITYRPFGQIRV